MSTLTKRTIAGIAILLIIIAVIATRNNTPTGDMTIGVILPTTGEYGHLGMNIVYALEVAEAELEQSSDVEITLIVEDDQLDSAKGVSAYQKLTSIDAIDALIIGSAPTFEAIYDDAKSRNLPVIAINTETRDETDDNVFAIRPAANEVSNGLGMLLRDAHADAKIVAIRTNDTLIRKLGIIFDEALGKEPTTFWTNRDSNEYPTVAAKVLAENPDVIVISMYATDGALLVKELMRQSNGSVAEKIVFDSIFNENIAEYRNILGDLRMLDGSSVVSLKTELTPAFVDAYTAMHGTEPGALADLGYDSLITLANAYHPDSATWIENMSATEKLTGASGAISFDTVGLRKAEYRFTTMTDGAIPTF